MRSYLTIALLLLSSIRASAQMVSAADVNFWKAEYGHSFSYTEIGRSFPGFYSAGFAAYSFNAGEGPSLEAEVANFSKILKRWNAPDEQANIYVGAGIGRGRRGSNSGLAASASFSADWENRSWHAMLQEQVIFVPGGSRLASTLHLGWAPYLAEYDDWAPWIYWTLQHENGDGVGFAHGPSLVLMHQNYLVELRVMKSSHGYHAEAGFRTLF